MKKDQKQAGTDPKGTIWTAGVNSGRGSHYKRSPLRVRKPMFSSSSNRAPSSSYPASKTNPSGSVNQRRFSEVGGLEKEGEESQVHLVYSHTSAMNGQDAAVNHGGAPATASIGIGTMAKRDDEVECELYGGQ